MDDGDIDLPCPTAHRGCFGAAAREVLLDTNVLSDARRGTFPTLNEWLENQPTNGLAISSITLFALEHG